MKRSFTSDNSSGIHPEVLAAIVAANSGHEPAYGTDSWTDRVKEAFRSAFGEKASAFLVSNGTAANVLGLMAMTRPHHAIVCSDVAHIHTSECGATERFTGCKLILVPSKLKQAKLSPQTIAAELKSAGKSVHKVQPRVVSITQSTELGTMYTLEEIRLISSFCKENGLLLHMDGARLANAAAALNCGLKELTADAGVDVLSFGGTKNGLMGAEAVIIFNPTLSVDFEFTRKQSLQLISKMRFTAAQFLAYFEDDLWRRNAAHSNSMAQLLSLGAREVTGVELPNPTQVNSVFAVIPDEWILPLQSVLNFHVWQSDYRSGKSLVRWVCSFDTTPSDVDEFVGKLRELSREHR